MFDIKLFEFESYNVRVVMIDDEPWFVGKDVAEILGYKNTSDALKRHCDDTDMRIVDIRDFQSEIVDRDVIIDTGNPNIRVINESGLYALIFGSQLDTAKVFKRWVTSDLLPKLRKQGYYIAKPNNEEILMNAIRDMTVMMSELKQQNIERQQENKKLQEDIEIIKDDYKNQITGLNETITEYEEEKEELQIVFNEFPGLEKAVLYMMSCDNLDNEGFTLKEYLESKPKVKLDKGDRVRVGQLASNWISLSRRFPLTKLHGITIYHNRHIEILDLAIKYVQGLIY